MHTSILIVEIFLSKGGKGNNRKLEEQVTFATSFKTGKTVDTVLFIYICPKGSSKAPHFKMLGLILTLPLTFC